MPVDRDKSLEAHLAKLGFEVTSTQPAGPDKVKVEANKIQSLPLPGEETVYAPIPVSLSVTVGRAGQVKSIEGGEPSEASVKSAVHFLKMLRETGQVKTDQSSPPVDGQTGQKISEPTHQIVRDEQGRQVLRRIRASTV